LEARVPEVAAGAQALLQVRDLRTVFARRRAFGLVRSQDVLAAVDGVSFDVGEGETLGVVGESGCGKTTLGRTILRLIPATSGSVRYEGHELLTLPARDLRRRRRELQMIFQDLDAALNPKMRVGALLAEALTLNERRSRQQVRERSEELLDLVNLKPAKLLAYPPELSGGEKRRISIARVLAVEPRLIVADEPLSALDVSIAAQVANLMRDLQQRLRLTYIFISHDLRMVELIAHRVIVMYLGQVVETAPARVLSQSAAHPYSRLLWSAVDPLGGRRAAGAGTEWQGELAEHTRISEGCRFRSRCPVYRERGQPDLCRTADTSPTLRTMAEGHAVACHFPLSSGQSPS
jgi:oligopeptide transport system ATP-binding protein